MKIVLIGAPGSGKGSLSNVLVAKHHFVHVSTGNLFRKEIESGSNLGIEVKNIISSGQLVSDEITNKIIKNELLKLSSNNQNFILDGYPRTIAQAEFLDSIIHLDHVFLLDVNYDLVTKRITGRRMCPKCSAIYNIYFQKPKKDNLCDHDQTFLFQRKDDDASVVKNRLKTYEELTKPLIQYYQQKGILKTLDASGEVSATLKQIEKFL